MTRAPWAALILILASGIAPAQTPPAPPPTVPVAKLTAPESVQGGNPIVVYSAGSVSAKPLKLKVKPAKFAAFLQVATLPDGSVIGVIPGEATESNPGTYRFSLLAVASDDIDADDASVVVTPAPTPVNPPVVPSVDPTPAPAPPPPVAAADRLGLTASTRALLRSMTWSNESLRWRQQSLAPIFAGVASRVASYTSGQAMILDVSEKTKAAIGPTLWPQWDASLFVPLRAQLVSLTAAKKITDAADVAEALTEIANALIEGD